jgi:hypothetical protein
MVSKLAGIGIASAAVLCLGSAPAAGVEDLTGTYTGKLACRQIGDGNTFKAKRDVELVLEDLGNGQVNFSQNPGSGQAVLFTETAKPDRGVLTGVACSLAATSFDGSAFRLDVKTKAGDDAVTLKGTLLFVEDTSGSSGVCQIVLKRTSTAPVKLGGCPSP